MLVSSVNSQTDTNPTVKQQRRPRKPNVPNKAGQTADAGGGVKVGVATLLVNNKRNGFITRMFDSSHMETLI